MPVKRRRLNDLYIVGRPVTVGEDTEEPVEIWLQKINRVQNEDCLRRANAARVRARAFMKDQTTDEWLDAEATVKDYASEDVLIDLAIAEELRQRRSRIEAELAADEEWSTDDYLQGLVDAWDGGPGDPGLKERWVEDKDDPEASRVKGELDRFDAKVKELVDAEHEALKRDFESTSPQEVLAKAVERVLEQRATQAFIDEYEAWQMFYAVREPDAHDTMYFTDVMQVRTLEEKVIDTLMTNYRELVVDITEGKDSPGTPGSSPSSEPPEQPETEPSSGPQVVSR